jgi:hypothetical protein
MVSLVRAGIPLVTKTQLLKAYALLKPIIFMLKAVAAKSADIEASVLILIQQLEHVIKYH